MELCLEERRAILEEIQLLAGEPELAPNEVTVRMYAEAEGISVSIAASRLEGLWSSGKLARREVLHNGKRKNAYSVPRGE